MLGGLGNASLFASAQQRVTPGVTSDAIRIGMSAAFTGTSAALGTEYYRGAQALFSEINVKGGVFGRELQLVARDDGYEPNRTLDNTVQLIDEGVLCLFNYVGTPTLAQALPIIHTFDADDLVLVGNLTGAQIQREQPYVQQIYNVRASYYQEMNLLVDNLWRGGVRNFGVFYQLDAYGRNGTDGVVRALAAKGAELTAEATYQRGAGFEDDMSVAVGYLRDLGVEAVLTTGSYQACGAFIRTARDLGWEVPITSVSFVGSDAMLNLLQTAGQNSGRDYTQQLVTSQVVPTPDDTAQAAVAEYRSFMDKWQPDVPENLRDTTYQPVPYSFVGLEGFINARVLVSALRLAGEQLTRSKLRDTLDTLDTDIGLGRRLSFSADRNRALHQGFDAVYPTTVENGRWVLLRDWTTVI